MHPGGGSAPLPILVPDGIGGAAHTAGKRHGYSEWTGIGGNDGIQR